MSDDTIKDGTNPGHPAGTLKEKAVLSENEPLHQTAGRDKILKNLSQTCLHTVCSEDMLKAALQVVLEAFSCDRAWWVFPCDPEAEQYALIKEVTRPAWRREKAEKKCLPVAPENTEVFKNALAANHAIRYDPENPWPEARLSLNASDHIQSMLHVAIKPETGKPWLLGIHHCAEAHRFTAEEVNLLTEIAETLTDALNLYLKAQELQKNKSSLEEAQRIAQIGSWDLDLLNNVLAWSDEIYRLFGLKPQEFDATYEAFIEMVHPDDREAVNTAYMASLKNKTPYNIVHRLLLKDGSLKYVSEWGETFYDASGHPVRSIGTVQDITLQKQAEDKLRHSAVIIENMADAVTITNKDNLILDINRAYTEISGYAREEVLGKDPKLLKSDIHHQDFYRDLWRDLLSQGMWQGELWNRRKNGEAFPTWSTITAVQDTEGHTCNYVQVFSDISSIKRSQEELDFLAHHDPLTELPNRILFNDRLKHALAVAKREHTQVGVLFLDLDRFKNINDSLGHPAGDIVLQEAGQRIRKNLRTSDTVARLGGDEFIIIIEQIKKVQNVSTVANKLLNIFAQPFRVNEQELHLSVSLGISLYPNDGQETETLIRNADTAMYRAKEEGRNNFQFYTSSLTMAVSERLTLETALHHALEKNEFLLHYQPQYTFQKGEVTGVEALIRWENPELGLVSPDRFIPSAEDSGLILSIGEWVLETACTQMLTWLKNGYTLDHVSVNVSGIQIQRCDIVTTVRQVLKRTGLPAKYLEIEITESTAMQQLDRVIRDLSALSKMGIRISIDDFGTGHSSLSYLKRLPINHLKIDRAFVKDIPQNEDDMAIARAIVALGKSLDLGIIAEGIETEEQQDFLEGLGCDSAQGYFYSRPLAAELVVKFFQRTA